MLNVVKESGPYKEPDKMVAGQYRERQIVALRTTENNVNGRVVSGDRASVLRAFKTRVRDRPCCCLWRCSAFATFFQCYKIRGPQGGKDER